MAFKGETVLDIQSHISDKPTMRSYPSDGLGALLETFEKAHLKTGEDVEVPYSGTVLLCANGMIKIKAYTETRRKVKEGFEQIGTDEAATRKKKPKKDEESEKSIEKRNLIRTRDQLIAYAAENEAVWQSFITLTFKDNITDLTEANRAFQNWVDQTRRAFPGFAYLGVPEFQKRGAVHYHLLSNLRCGVEIPEREPIKTWNPEHKKWYMQFYHDIPYWTQGFSNAQDLASMDDCFNCALYVTKYLYKDIDDRLWGRKKILRSQNLRKPTKYYTDTATYQGVVAYMIEKGYPVTSYSFVPKERYQVPHMAYSCKERLYSDDQENIEAMLSQSYSERHA